MPIYNALLFVIFYIFSFRIENSATKNTNKSHLRLMQTTNNNLNSNSNNSTTTSNSTTNTNTSSSINSTTLLLDTYDDIFNPTDPKYNPQKIPLIANKKPSFILISNKTASRVVINNKVSISDYQYTGSLGLGAGTIAVIIFMGFGLLICIYGLSTEYPM